MLISQTEDYFENAWYRFLEKPMLFVQFSKFFFSTKGYFSCCRTNFLSPCVLAIASILFSNHDVPFYNNSLFAMLIFENNIRTFTVIDDVQL